MEKEVVYTPGTSDYELSRAERIRENRERMQKLGMFDLSLKFKSVKPSLNRAPRRKIDRGLSDSPLPQPGPTRRSSRLQNSTPVSYCETVAKNDKSLNDDDLLREVGSKPETYTEEHEKLLGSTERSWTLFVDGCGNDGKRIYDPVKGKTCHQCRQKTLGHRTNCSKCNLVQGQFCGDCLYMRYGENVLEANENPNWICPVCRGICNCSLCRQAKGWPPTGSLYRKISRLGYKSVAHYLIQTRRAAADSDKHVDTTVPISSKKSLPFSDIETTTGEDDLSNSKPSVVDKEAGKVAPESNASPLLESVITTQPKDQTEYLLNPEPKQSTDPEFAMETELDENRMEPWNDQIIPASSNHHGGGLLISNEIKKEEIMNTDNVDVGVSESSPKSTKKRVLSEPSPDNVAGRLRQRCTNPNLGKELDLANVKNDTRKINDTSEIADGDSIASRLKRRRRT